MKADVRPDARTTVAVAVAVATLVVGATSPTPQTDEHATKNDADPTLRDVDTIPTATVEAETTTTITPENAALLNLRIARRRRATRSRFPASRSLQRT
jgi:hypothetical protein